MLKYMNRIMSHLKRKPGAVIMSIVIVVVVGLLFMVHARPPGGQAGFGGDIQGHIIDRLEGEDLRPAGNEGVQDFDQAQQQEAEAEGLINGQLHIEQRLPQADSEERQEEAVGHARPLNDDDDDYNDDSKHQRAHKLGVEDLQPPDHLDGVRMEQDGHLNRDYKKEIFVGNHEEIETVSHEKMIDKLKDIFHKVDTDQNGYIRQEELETWIVAKIQEHFKEAAEENEAIFKQLDVDKDGLITWKEFHIEFLQAKGHAREKAEQHVEDYDTIPLDGEEKEQIIRYKFRWADADEEPQDNSLTLEEFRSFRHPEQSNNMLARMVRDILDNLDKDNDGILTEEEFTALPPGEVDEKWRQVDQVWQEERRQEFRKVIDLNKDGRVTRDELKNYVDPRNPSHATLEAKSLIELADSDRDGALSLREVLDNMDLFLGSKMVNTGKSFHDEF